MHIQNIVKDLMKRSVYLWGTRDSTRYLCPFVVVSWTTSNRLFSHMCFRISQFLLLDEKKVFPLNSRAGLNIKSVHLLKTFAKSHWWLTMLKRPNSKQVFWSRQIYSLQSLWNKILSASYVSYWLFTQSMRDLRSVQSSVLKWQKCIHLVHFAIPDHVISQTLTFTHPSLMTL